MIIRVSLFRHAHSFSLSVDFVPEKGDTIVMNQCDMQNDVQERTGIRFGEKYIVIERVIILDLEKPSGIKEILITVQNRDRMNEPQMKRQAVESSVKEVDKKESDF